MGKTTKAAFCLSLALVCTLPSRTGFAFGLNTHLAVANDALSGSKGNQVDLGRFGSIRGVANELMRFSQKWPDYYRAGALGPDAFPDLVGGQLFVHVNRMKEKCEKSKKKNCRVATTVHEMRPLDEWRSIDSAMYVLDRAVRYYKMQSAVTQHMRDLVGNAATAALLQTGEQAIAFAMGYLSHVSADSFSHGYVNEFAGGYFTLWKGDGIFGQVTEELKHMAVERYINSNLAPSAGPSTIKVPQPFLRDLYTTKPTASSQRWTRASAGAFGGPHFEALAKVRNAFKIMSDHDRWKSGNSETSKILPRLIDVHQSLLKIGTLGSGAGDPVAGIEHFFATRYEMVQALEDGWLKLGECIAQNLVEGQRIAGPLKKDACQQDFESTSNLAKLFRGSLNKAARKENGDPGSLEANLSKVAAFASTIAERLLDFDPNTDLKDLAQLHKVAKLCEQRLIKWKSCENACNMGEEVCDEVLKGGVCIGCPKKKGKYSCSGWKRGLRCTALPHCFACAADPFKSVCKVSVEGAAPVCAFCNENSICQHYKEAMRLHYKLQDLVKEIPEKLMRPLKEELKRALIDHFIPKQLEQTFAILTAAGRAYGIDSAATGVNIAFLAEDLSRDAKYLNRILDAVLDKGAKIDENANFNLSVGQNFKVTKTRGIQALRKAARNAQPADWNAYLNTLMGLSRNSGVWAKKFPHLRDREFKWLDGLNVAGLRRNASRLERFVAISQRSGLFAGIQGPTLALLHRQTMRGQSFNRTDFGPYANSVQLSKLSMLSEDAIDGLYQSVGLATPARIAPSALCKSAETFTVLCDAVHSLDDPNSYGEIRPENTLLKNTTQAVFPGGSTVAWQSATNAHTANKESCVMGRTQFLLASTNQSISQLYRRLFILPERCRKQQIPGKPPKTPVVQQKHQLRPLRGKQTDIPFLSTVKTAQQLSKKRVSGRAIKPVPSKAQKPTLTPVK